MYMFHIYIYVYVFPYLYICISALTDKILLPLLNYNSYRICVLNYFLINLYTYISSEYIFINFYILLASQGFRNSIKGCFKLNNCKYRMIQKKAKIWNVQIIYILRNKNSFAKLYLKKIFIAVTFLITQMNERYAYNCQINETNLHNQKLITILLKIISMAHLSPLENSLSQIFIFKMPCLLHFIQHIKILCWYQLRFWRINPILLC